MTIAEWLGEKVRELHFAISTCLAILLMCRGASAMSYPPYDIYPYLADSTDNPPLNYTKVCEPGRTGEENASYVVLGVFFPRSYHALANTGYDGDLEIPAYIDGLPARPGRIRPPFRRRHRLGLRPRRRARGRDRDRRPLRVRRPDRRTPGGMAFAGNCGRDRRSECFRHHAVRGRDHHGGMKIVLPMQSILCYTMRGMEQVTWTRARRHENENSH